jgi:hypothetical protein
MDTIDCPKCGYEHTPTGNHEDDSGEMECDGCKFRFIVDVEYDPCYYTHCKSHEWENKISAHADGTKYLQCVHCGGVKLYELAPQQEPTHE